MGKVKRVPNLPFVVDNTGTKVCRWSYTNGWQRIKPTKNKKTGYLVVSYSYLKDGIRKNRTFGLHQLVMLAFVGPCSKGMEVCHYPDRNQTNNHVNNLKYDTRKNNNAHKKEQGTYQYGDKIGTAVLSNKEAEEIRNKYIPYSRTNSMKRLSLVYGCDVTTIEGVINGKHYKVK